LGIFASNSDAEKADPGNSSVNAGLIGGQPFKTALVNFVLNALHAAYVNGAYYISTLYVGKTASADMVIKDHDGTVLVTFDKTSNNVTTVIHERINYFKEGQTLDPHSSSAYFDMYQTPIMVRYDYTNLIGVNTPFTGSDVFTLVNASTNLHGGVSYLYSGPDLVGVSGKIDLKHDLTNGMGSLVLGVYIFPRYKLDTIKMILALVDLGSSVPVEVNIRISKVIAATVGAAAAAYDDMYTIVHTKTVTLNSGDNYQQILESGINLTLDPRYQYLVSFWVEATDPLVITIPEFYLGINHYQGSI
jgi:hypothetical protein